jgi:hypothetical protein
LANSKYIPKSMINYEKIWRNFYTTCSKDGC